MSKCPSYISNYRCNNNLEAEHTWCTQCSKFFVKKQSRYKSLEKKYYSEDHIVPENLEFDKLYKIYNKLALALSLRRYIYNYGFYPEIRDNGHRIRIENVKKYRKIIKLEIQKKHEQSKKSEISEMIENPENVEEQPDKPLDTVIVNKIERISRCENMDDILHVHKFRNYMHNIYSKLINDFKEIISSYLIPKLGRNFWDAFCLQYALLGYFCDHKIKPIKRGKMPKQGIIAENIEHSYCDKGKRYINNRKFITDSSRSTNMSLILETGIKEGFRFTNQLDIYLNLHRQIRNLLLPSWIKKIIYDPTDKDIENLTPQYYKKYEVSKLHGTRREAKIDLLRNKREIEFNYDIQSCMRANSFGDREFHCVITGTDNPEKYLLTYCAMGHVIPSTIIDVANYKCNHTFGAIIVLDESIFDYDQEILSICKASHPDTYLDFMKQYAVMDLENGIRYLFTF
jgi:hypothetical protein